LKDARLFANPKKCEFDKSEVEYLGYLIGADGIKMNPKKLATIAKWPVPCRLTTFKFFLDFVISTTALLIIMRPLHFLFIV
jgi:hypothetical protein